jgi:chromosome segregation ATPase
MQKLFEHKLNDQQTTYQANIQQCENDYEKKIQLLKQEVKQWNEKYHLIIQQNDQLQNDLKQKNHELKQFNETCSQQRDLIEKSERAFVQIKNDLEKKFHDKVILRYHFFFQSKVKLQMWSLQISNLKRISTRNCVLTFLEHH